MFYLNGFKCKPLVRLIQSYYNVLLMHVQICVQFLEVLRLCVVAARLWQHELLKALNLYSERTQFELGRQPVTVVIYLWFRPNNSYKCRDINLNKLRLFQSTFIIHNHSSGKFSNVVLEKDGEDQLDRSCEK